MVEFIPLLLAPRCWRPLSFTLGPERLPVHRDFAQDRQTKDFGCNSCGGHPRGRADQMSGFSHALREVPRECEHFSGSHHNGRRQMSTPLPLPAVQVSARNFGSGRTNGPEPHPQLRRVSSDRSPQCCPSPVVQVSAHKPGSGRMKGATPARQFSKLVRLPVVGTEVAIRQVPLRNNPNTTMRPQFSRVM